MRKRATIWAGLLAIIAGILWAGLHHEGASAHALLAHSLPEADAVLSQAPSKIELWFTEGLEPGFSRARLFDSNGQEVPTGAVSLDPNDDTHMTLALKPLKPGIYTVAWQTLSKADGHEFSGSFPFTLLNPDGTRPNGATATTGGATRSDLPQPAEFLARWLLLLGSALLFGIPLFQSIIVSGSFPTGSRETIAIEASSGNLAVLAVWISTLALTMGQGLHVLAQSVDLGGLDKAPELLLGTRAGTLILGRQAVALTILLVALKLPQPKPVHRHIQAANIATGLLVALLAVTLMPAAAQGNYLIALPPIGIAYLGLGVFIWMRGETTPPTWRKIWAFLTVLAVVLLLSISLASHAGAGSGSVWAVLGDFIHLLAAGAWVGGLFLMGALLLRHYRSPEASRRPLFLLVRRFSYLASFCVFVLVLSGLFNSLVQLPRLSLLWQSIYGRVLLVKLGLIALAMGIAFLNNRLVHVGARGHKATDIPPRLDRQVVLEAGVVVLLMASVAILVQTPTPRDAALANAAQPAVLPFNTVVVADDLSLHVQVSPNQVGKSRFWVHIYHDDGSPVGEIQLVQLRFNYRDMPLGQSKADLAPLGGDTFAIEGAYLSQPGAWDLSAYIRRRDKDDTLARFSLDVPKPSVRAISSNPWQNPIPGFSPWLVGLCLLAALVAIPILWHEPLRQVRTRYKISWRGGSLIAFAALSIGLVLLLSFGISYFNASGPGRARSSEAVSYELGKSLYEERCASCHGPTGLGNGPAAAGLNPPPANLQIHLAGGVHTDEQIFNWISNGIPNTAMPAFGTILSEDSRWQIISYVRTLVPKEGP